jgi:signal transduction histidine kinase
MHQVANRAIDALRRQLPGASMPRIDIGPMPTLEADAGLWQQVFVNLFSNAVKFTGNVAEPHIFLTAKNIGNEFVFELSDNGAGFSPESGAGLFQPFQRLHGRSFEGTGLGLTIVRRIIERHGGRVWARGEVGSGARFFLGLPVQPSVQQSMTE